MKKISLWGLILLSFGALKAQDVTYTTADIVAGVVQGSTTATLTKSGYSLTITKTGGSTNPVSMLYPNGSPLNTLPADPSNNIEGLHIGRTWGANGTGWIDAYGQLRSEDYSFVFSNALDQFDFTIGALNDNTDGIEKFRIVDVLNGGVSVLSSCTFSIRVDVDVWESDSIVFNQTTRDIEGQGTPKANGWNESSVVTIKCATQFDRIIFQRMDYANGRPDVNAGGQNYTNGLTITGFAAYLAEPEIDVKGNFVSIVNGDVSPAYTDSTNFGTFYINQTTTKTYWIHNTGTGNLTLTGGTPVTISGSGTFTISGQPSSNTVAPGDSVSFDVTFTGSSLGTKTATVSIANDDPNENPYTFNVQAVVVNRPPVAVNDNKTTTEDVCVNVDVQVNDSDPDGDALTTTIITDVNHGTTTILNNDSIQYCPDNNFNGLDTLFYSVCDGNGACDTARVIITITPVNDDPIANTDKKTTTEDQCVNVDVQVNDTDVEGNPLTTSIFSQANNGTATLLNNDSIQYCPDNNFNGIDTLIYQICDGQGGCDTALVIITVTPVNDDPIANTDKKTTTEDQCVNVDVQVNDTDTENGVLTTSIFSQANNGTATLLNNDSIQYCPDNNFNGIDTLIYQICDGQGGCDTALVIITVNPVNDDPIAVNDNKTTLKNTCVNVDVQVNDSDPENDPLTTSIITDVNNGTTTLLNNDSIQYCPDNNFFGKDTLFYSICDGNGGCDTARVIITINNVNNNPDAKTDYKTTLEDVCVNVDVQVNDVDIDGDPLTTSIFTQANNGTATLLNNDSIQYCPDNNFNGTDTLIYQICDGLGGCDTAQVIITITPVNDDPIANTDKKTTTEDQCVNVDVQVNDTDVEGNPLTTSIFSQANNGTATLLNNDSIQYCPDNNFNGIDTLIYQICDGQGGCDTALVIITVTPVNDDPIANTDKKTTTEDQCVNVDVQVNDTDTENGVLTTSIFSQANNGTATLLNNDSIQYCPDNNFNGIDTLIYQICDGQGGCDTAMVIITVTPVNDDPIAVTDNKSTLKNTCVNVDVQVNDSDPENDPLSTSIIINPNNGTTSLLNNDSIQYCPDNNFVGKDTLTYSICDGNGGCDTALVIINVVNVNNNPDAKTDYKTTLEDVCVNVDVQVNDIDIDGDAFTTSIFTQALHGTASLLNGDSLQYCPNSNFNGIDTLIYQICDGLGGCDTAQVIITVIPVNDDPIATTDKKTTTKNQCVNVDVQVNDTDVDGDPLTTTIFTQGSNGTATVLAGNDSIQYCPDNNFHGKDTLIYQICDGNGGCDTAQVIITINNVNNNPDAKTDYKTTTEDVCVNVDVQVNDTDPDGDPLTTSIFTQALHGNATLLNADSLQYCPNNNFNGKDTIVYQICDGNGACDTAYVIITVTPVNDDPIATTDKKTTNKNQCVKIKVQSNDTDIDGDPLTTTIQDQANNGSGTVLNGDSIQYCPNNNFHGKDTIIYQICDGNGGCDTAQVIITINNIDPIVVAHNDSANIYSNNPNTYSLIVKVQVNDTDYNGGYLTTVIYQDPTSGGVATVVNGDSISYTAPNGFYGVDTLMYIVCSSIGTDLNDCDTAYVFITVSGPDCDNDGIPDYADNPKDCEFFIPEGFSPEGNGINDKWVITGILNYPKNHVQIFNRWGNLVFETDGYQNEWDGTSMFGLMIGGNELPEGTYFYIVDLGLSTNNKVYKGYVYLKR